jgi:hypothetical protein
VHWVLQHNLYHEQGMRDLIAFLERMDIPHSEHKIIPFVGEIEPDIDIEGNVICIGSYSMRHLAKRKGWVPGVFDLGGITYRECIEKWGTDMLNHDAVIVPLHEAVATFDKVQEDGLVFVRPIADSKDFAGAVFDLGQLEYLWKGIHSLGEEADPAGLRRDTLVMISAPKNIAREYRFWIVDGNVVTGSQYKLGNRILYSGDIDRDVETFAHSRVVPISVDKWNPLRAFVLDVALMRDGSKKVVELNTLNAAGLYAADVGKLVSAIEDMRF